MRLERGQFRVSGVPDFLGTHRIPPQHVAYALIREHLGQLLIEEVHLQGPGAQQLVNLGFGNRRNVMEPVLGKVFDLLAFDHAAVAHEGDRGDAKSALELRHLRSHGVWILRIAGKHFDGDRMPVLVAE